MSYFKKLLAIIAGMKLLLIANVALAQIYSENFDDLNAATRWTAFAGVGFDSLLSSVPMDTNFDRVPSLGVDGVNDDFSGFAFDYSSVGIPSAPNSLGNSTIGLKLQASLFSNALGGFSVSPNGLNLSGDYVVTFDAWSNTVGPFPAGGSGSTNLSTFGILTSGTFSQSILSSDGVFFAYSGEGQSSADYRAYSVEDTNSYDGTTGEPHATYHAGTRNVPAGITVPGTGVPLYNDAFGTGRTVPQAQIDIFGPSGTNTSDQTGIINGGAAGFAWHHHEIKKKDNTIEWFVNGYLLITVDSTEFSGLLGGGNISFGHTDVNFTSSSNPAAPELIFTLIDNVSVIPEPEAMVILAIGFIGAFSIRWRTKELSKVVDW